MRLRNVKNKDELIKNCDYLVNNATDFLGKWNQVFGNSNPIHIEVGMGKGSFIKGMAKAFPNINFVGIEVVEGIVAKAIKNINDDIPQNLRLIQTDASLLPSIFDHEIGTLYLNFSDPWPKKRHANRRLTSPTYLSYYESIFKGDKIIVMKTDNTGLYAYSLVSLNECGYKIVDASLDLHSEEDRFNIETEYEQKFSSQGVKINYLKAIKK